MRRGSGKAARPVAALAAALAIAAGCGDNLGAAGADSGGDGPPRWPQLDGPRRDAGHAEGSVPDAGPDGPQWQMDAGPCSVLPWDAGPPLPTHGAIFVYDRVLETSLPLQENAPHAVFVDADGVVLFGSKHFTRATHDGDFLYSKPYPARPEDGERMIMQFWFAQTPSGYAAIADYVDLVVDARMCLVSSSGDIDAAACTSVLIPRSLIWDGTYFWVFGLVDDTTTHVTRLDASGAIVDSRWFAKTELGVGAFHLLGDQVAALVSRKHDTGCESFFLETYPQSLDMSTARRWDLLPPDFKASWGPIHASNDRRAMFFYEGVCWQFPWWLPPGVNGCDSNWPPFWQYATYMTVVDLEGEAVVLSQRVVSTGYDLKWDGEKFVQLSSDTQGPQSSAEVLVFNALDEDGAVVAAGARPNFRYAFPPNRLASWAFAVVAPNDYVVVYTLTNTSDTYIARFRLVPL